MTSDDRRTRSPEPKAGGIFLALLPIAGAVIGGLAGQPSIGLIAGLALGIALALLVYLRDRR